MCPLRYFSERLKTLALCRDLSMSKRLRRTCFVDLNKCLSKDFNKGFRQQQKDQKGTVVVQSLSEMSRACWEIFLGWLRASRYGNDADTAAGWKVHQLVRRFSQQTSIYRLFIVDVPIFSRGSLPEIAIFLTQKMKAFVRPLRPLTYEFPWHLTKYDCSILQVDISKNQRDSNQQHKISWNISVNPIKSHSINISTLLRATSKLHWAKKGHHEVDRKDLMMGWGKPSPALGRCNGIFNGS